VIYLADIAKTRGVFGFAFEIAFAFQKVKSQPNTLAFQSCFFTSTKLKAAAPYFYLLWRWQLRKKIPTCHLQKINGF